MLNQLSIAEANEIIRNIPNLKIKFTRHARERMEERYIEDYQVHELLSRITNENIRKVTYNEQHDSWEVTLEGSTAGDWIKVVIGISCLYGSKPPLAINKCDLTIITVIYIE